jgi:hypothetical protein
MSQIEGKYTAEFLVSEGEGSISHDDAVVTVGTGAKLKPGAVLALVGTKYVEYDNAGTDGSQTAKAILYAEADNTAGGAPVDFDRAVIARLAEVRAADLEWFSGASAGDKTAGIADLAAAFIIAR